MMMTETAPAEKSSRSARSRTLKTLRQIHGWLGLWGAVLGLLFGVSGVLLNHRAVLKIPAAKTQESTVQLPLPDVAPDTPRAFSAWLQKELQLTARPGRVREEPARPVAWGEQGLMQPAHWTINFARPGGSVQADYWVGNRYVTVKRGENNVFAFLSNLHKGVGLGVGWVLLIDTLAGSIIVLSITGTLLWFGMNRRRQTGGVVVLAALAATVALASL